MMVKVTFYLLAVMSGLASTVSETSTDPPGYHPCCSFPCQNKGICSSNGFSDYCCDCTRTGYYGRNCEHGTLWTIVTSFLTLSPETKHHLLLNYQRVWDIVNNVPVLNNILAKNFFIDRVDNVYTPPIYTSAHEYVTITAAFNRTYFARSLPPVHHNCPTPMGVAGKKQLPDPQIVVDRLFKRKEFKPDPLGSSAHIPSFGQHFSHQFFKTDFKKGWEYQWSAHGIDAAHIYGRDKHDEDILRTFESGRLKSQIIKDEEYPPYNKDAPVHMTYPPNTPDDHKFALGHEFFGLLPTLFLYATVWLREHNRVVAILSQEHPDWSDEQLYQTGKLVIVGENIRLAVTDYLPLVSNYNLKSEFNPELLFGISFHYQNRICLEFNHLYHWHTLMPEELRIGNKVYTMTELVFNPQVVIEHGVSAFAEALSIHRAGEMTHMNHGETTLDVAKKLISEGRKLRLQPFNQYRKRYGMAPYTSFYDMTGNRELAETMEEMYGHIDGLEFYVGIVTEKHSKNAKFGLTMLEMGLAHAIPGLLGNPILSPTYWKPSTFGGQIGFDIINQASIKNLFCKNIKGKCPFISFTVPENAEDGETCRGKTCDKTDL